MDILCERDAGYFRNGAVQDLIRSMVATRETQAIVLQSLIAHEVEGARFLRELTALQQIGNVGLSWNYHEHLRDELNHVRYFQAMARTVSGCDADQYCERNLTEEEKTVFLNPQEFFLGLYVAERFSASYLRALRLAWPDSSIDEHAKIASVLEKVEEDERRHCDWVLGGLSVSDTVRVRDRMVEIWSDLEISHLNTAVNSWQNSSFCNGPMFVKSL